MLADRGGGGILRKTGLSRFWWEFHPPRRHSLGGGGPSCYGEDNKPSLTPSMTNTNYHLMGSKLEILKTLFAHLSFFFFFLKLKDTINM